MKFFRSRFCVGLLLVFLNPSAYPAQPPEFIDAIEIAAQLPHAVGNIAFTPEGRMIFSFHPFFNHEIKVAELHKNGHITPFPNLEMNLSEAGDSSLSLDAVLGIRGDSVGKIWILDAGTRTKVTPKLVVWDTHLNKLAKIIYIPPPASRSISFLNDFVIDSKNRKVYIADEGIGPGGDGSKAALVIVDLDTGLSKRVLEADRSTLPENVPITVDGNELTVKDEAGEIKHLRIGADGIALDKDSQYLYFGPLSGKSLYRVAVDDLLSFADSKERLSAKVERYSDKPNNGGLSIDKDNNIYFTEIESRSIGLVKSDRQYSKFRFHESMVWPDGVSYSPDGYMYVSAAQISRAAAFNKGNAGNKEPYLIFRFKPLADGIQGM